MANSWRPSGSVLATPSPHSDARLQHHARADAYRKLIARARRLVESSTQPGARVLVASKGDSELIEFTSRRGAHFLQEPSGTYAGHHPGSDAEAIDQLEHLVNHGANHLLLPATASWWWDKYPLFIEHLETIHRLVGGDPDTGALYALGVPGANDTPVHATPSSALAEEIDRLVRTVIPVGALVVVPADGAELSHNCTAWSVSQPGDETGDAGALYRAVADLDALRQDGAQYLLIPLSQFELIDRVPGLSHHLLSTYRVVLDQQQLGTVFALDEHVRPTVGATTPGRATKEG